jgi:hypothetical protein
MRLTVGLTKKRGLPGFGSVGALCQLESAEFAAGDRDEFERRVERAFDACRRAVEEELARHGYESKCGADGPDAPGRDLSSRPPVGEQAVVPRPGQFAGPPATVKQRSALRAMTSARRLSQEELGRVFGGKALDALTVSEASAAIERLQRRSPPPANRRHTRSTEGGP